MALPPCSRPCAVTHTTKPEISTRKIGSTATYRFSMAPSSNHPSCFKYHKYINISKTGNCAALGQRSDFTLLKFPPGLLHGAQHGLPVFQVRRKNLFDHATRQFRHQPV